MIGVSMILTIALCAVGFTIIYTALDGFTSDFVSRTDDTPTVVAAVAPQQNEAPAPTAAPEQEEAPAEQPAEQGQVVAAADPSPTPTPDANDEDEDGFDPDYEISSDVRINLRSGPSTATGILDSLDPGTQLEYLDEEAPTDSPADGDRWMRFATEDGLEGWVREIDVSTIQ